MKPKSSINITMTGVSNYIHSMWRKKVCFFFVSTRFLLSWKLIALSPISLRLRICHSLSLSSAIIKTEMDLKVIIFVPVQ